MNRAKELAELAARELSIDERGMLEGAPALAVHIQILVWRPAAGSWEAVRAGGFMIEPDKVALEQGYAAPSGAMLGARIMAAYPELATGENPESWR